jgi:predicted ArsR family transcriptional regulator
VIDLPLAASPGDPLAQPTRARLFALLGELARPASTVELADQLGLHPNGVRLHLERLEQAGLVTRAREHRPRGRPRDAWAVAPEARPAGEPPRAYGDLGRWLARALGSPRPGPAGVEETGREIGRELAPAGATDASESLPIALAALGFQPHACCATDGSTTVTLRNCPYRDAVHESPEIVCALHRGITAGLLEVIEPGSRLASFTPRDPDHAGCLIQIESLR